MILEGVVTTRNEDGSINVAPMGPIVDDSMRILQLRPFQSSRTYANLKRKAQGVFHVTDDVVLLARAAIGDLPSLPEMKQAEHIDGEILCSACRWYEFEVREFDDAAPRTNLRAEVVHSGKLRDFFGFNRAKHAVLEAAILATRVHLIEADEIRRQFAALRIPMEKTCGPREREAFELLERYVSDAHSGHYTDC